ncbi:hypothetical protein NDN08_007118 [Rhodosorus marinus]|uniref:Uncharacterized protein n=1 Tax=Rhodosorus marinus TaxID=101924 RepID=A0AAV8UH33_9RHOD|nr:hypothetical protein NDN08_007118 [Rhodosorus marinus]
MLRARARDLIRGGYVTRRNLSSKPGKKDKIHKNEVVIKADCEPSTSRKGSDVRVQSARRTRKFVPIGNAWTSVNSTCSSWWMDGQTEQQTLLRRGESQSPEAMVNVDTLESEEMRTSKVTEDHDIKYRQLKTPKLSLNEKISEEQSGPESKMYKVDQAFVQSNNLSLALAPEVDHSSCQRISPAEVLARAKQIDFE